MIISHKDFISNFFIFLAVVFCLALYTEAQEVYAGISPAYTFSGEAAGDYFGSSVAIAGDVNNDGYDDIIIGAPNNDAGGVDAGKAYVYSGRDSSLLYSFTGEAEQSDFGYKVSGSGDVNNDGYQDMIVGAPEFSGSTGRAYVLSGFDGSVLYAKTGESAGWEFGKAVDGVGDINSDGYDDFSVGAPWDRGKVYLYSGRTGELIRALAGTSPGDGFGRTLAGVGDVDGDHIPDIAVGSLKNYVSLYSGQSGALLHTFLGSGGFGSWDGLDGAGDVNNDGYNDIIIGAYAVNGKQGCVYVYSGKDYTLLYNPCGEAADDYFGVSVSGAGDVTGDEFADFLVGAENKNSIGYEAGKAYLYSGRDGVLLATFLPDAAGGRFGTAVDGGGYLNEDSLPDLVIGANSYDATGTNAGRVYGYLCDPLAFDLVGYWSFDEGSGVTAHDYSGYGNNGTLMNAPTWVDGISGSALSLDGIDDYVYVSNSASLQISNSITVAGWAKVENSTGDHQIIVAKWYGDAGQYVYSYVLEFQPDGRTPQLLIKTVGGATYGTYAVSNVTVPFGEWAHIAGTYDGSNVKIYVNGLLTGSTPLSGSINVGNQPVLIGAHTALGDRNWFNGILDEIRIYEGALSDVEIESLYNSTRPNFTIEALPDYHSVLAGQSTNYAVVLTSFFGFSSPCSLKVAGLPNSMVAHFDQNPIVPTDTALLTISTGATTLPGTYELIITATEIGQAGIQHSTRAILRVFASQSVLFYDNFDDGDDSGWTVIEGAWAVQSGAYAGLGGDARSTVPGQPNWTDIVYEGRFMLDPISPFEAGIMFRFQDGRSGVDLGHYYVITNYESDAITLWRISDGATNLLRVNYPIVKGRWYDFRVKLMGDSLQYFIDDHYLFSYLGLSDYRYGGIGVKAYGSKAHFDEIIVTANCVGNSPNTYFTSGANENQYINTNEVMFTWTGLDDSTSAENLLFSYSLDSATFSPFNYDTAYTFTGLTEGWHTVMARAMDESQNIDPSPATRHFAVDLTSPNTQIVSGPSEGEWVSSSTVTFGWSGSDNLTSSVELLFSYKIDTDTFSDFTSQNNRTYNNLSEGSHTFVVRAKDKAGNIDLAPAQRSFSVGLLSLLPTNISVPDSAFCDSKIGISWTVKNNGIGPAVGSWMDKIYLSSDNQVGLDSLLAKISHSDTLTPLESYSVTDSVLLPDSIQGFYWVVVGSEGGNFLIDDDSINVSIPPHPDLQVTDIQLPDEGWSGQKIDVQWTVTNLGEAAANKSWKEYVYLSNDDSIGSDVKLSEFNYTEGLGEGQSYTHLHTVTLPEDISGDFWIVVRTDAENNIAEYELENNNIRISVDSLPVYQSPYSDLKVTLVEVPPSGVSGQSVQVSWSIKNDGSGATDALVWYDLVYLSTDTMFGTGDILLGSFQNFSYLGSGESYRQTKEIVLPWQLAGPYYFVVVADGTNRLFEHAGEGNNSGSSNPVIIEFASQPQPYLQISNVQVQSAAWSGQKISVSWIETNVGNAPTWGSWWDDAMALSKDEIYDDKDIWLSSHFFHYHALSPGQSDTLTGEISLPDTVSGNWYLILIPDTHGLASAGGTPVAALLTISPKPPADLEVTSISSSSDTVNSGDKLVIDWTVANNGLAPTLLSSWKDEVYLSTDETLSTNSDILLSSLTYSGNLEVDSSYRQTDTATVPSNLSGPYYVIVCTDVDSVVDEGAWENNNYTHTPSLIQILLTPPDLQVSTVTSDSTAWSGQSTNVVWSVTNAGVGRTVAESWHDRIFLSEDSNLNRNEDLLLQDFMHRGTLGPTEAYFETTQVTLPNGLSGTYYLFILTDADSEVYEYQAENNNSNYAIMKVNLTPPPDLRVSNISAATEAWSGKSITIQWNVINSGSGGTVSKTWHDKTYLSRDTVFSAINDTLIYDLTHSGALGAGQNYMENRDIVIPISALGDYYILVYTDADANVYEHQAKGNNIKFAQIHVDQTAPELPDLQVINLQVPSNILAGASVTIDWTVTNIGQYPTPLNPSYWSDALYLSPDSILEVNSDTVLGTASYIQRLAPDSSYTRSKTVTFPNNLSGKYYLFSVADYKDTIPEYSEVNNTFSSPVHIEFKPPDLQVMLVNPPDSVVSGQALQVSYGVVNAGTGPTHSSRWYDALYLSKDQILDEADNLLGSLRHNGVLDSAQSYTDTIEANIPLGLSGPYYAIVRTDKNNEVYEYNKENNNYKHSQNVVQVVLPPPVDLVVSSIVVPDSAIAGDSVEINWTVSNVGQNTAQGQWTDALYLSDDTLWSLSDPLIGTVLHTGGLEPGKMYRIRYKLDIAEYIGTLKGDLPGVVPGNYHVIVRTDILNNVSETNETNNSTTSADTITVDIRALTLGVPDASQLYSNDENYYRAYVDRNIDVRLTICPSFQSDIFQLFIRSGEIPDRIHYDLAYQIDSCYTVIIPCDSNESLYLMLRGEHVSGVGNYTILADSMPFGVLSIDPTQGGNVGSVTIHTSGGGFVPETRVSLISSSNDTIAGQSYYFENSASMFVTFDLVGIIPGLYSLVLQRPDSCIATFPMGFEVNQGQGSNFFARIVGPQTVRAGQAAIASIEYGNLGDVDIIAPWVGIRCLQGEYLRMGFASPLQTEIAMPIISHSGPPWLLRPGSADRISTVIGPSSLDLISLDLFSYSSVPLGYGFPMPESNPDSIASGQKTDPIKCNIMLTFDDVKTMKIGELIDAARNAVGNNQLITGSFANVHDNSPEGYAYVPVVWKLTVKDPTVTLEPGVVQLLASKNSILGYHGFNHLTWRLGCLDTPDVAADLALWKSRVGWNEDMPLLARLPGFSVSPETRNFFAEHNIKLVGGVTINDWLFRYLTIGLDPSYWFDNALRNLALYDLGQRAVDEVKKQCSRQQNKPVVLILHEPFLEATDVSYIIERLKSEGGSLVDFNPNPDPLNHNDIYDIFPYDDPDKNAACSKFAEWLETHNLSFIRPKDPNEKLGPSGTEGENLITLNQLLPYAVYFENTPDASAPALSVKIDDQLDPDLDWRRFRLGEIAFGDTTLIVPDNSTYWHTTVDLDSLNLQLEIDAGINAWTGETHWYFETVDPNTGLPPLDPFTGFLPPNDSTGRGQGHISYTIKAKADLSEETEITNKATIVFDTNDPIETNEVSNVIHNILPDLVATSFGVDYDHIPIRAGDEVIFKVTVENQSDIQADSFSVSLFGGNPDSGAVQIGQVQKVSSLSAQLSRELSFTCTSSEVISKKVVYVVIDSENLIIEANEKNNIRSINVLEIAYRPGDVNADTWVNITDVIYLINYLFKGGPNLIPQGAGRVNCDTVVNVTDVIYLINYLFKNGPPPCISGQYSIALSKSNEQGYIRSSFVKFDEENTVIVSITKGAKVDIAAVQLELEYSSTDIDKIEVYPAERTEKLGLYYLAKDGKLSIGLLDLYGRNYISSGEGPLLSLRLKTKGENPDLSSLRIERAVLVDTLARELQVTVINDIKTPQIPKSFSLSQNYPNPFNPYAVIEFALSKDCQVKLCIYNILGQKVRTLVDENLPAGYRRVIWDSKNDQGQEVATGVYFYRIQAGDFTQSKKMVLMK